MVAPIGAIPMTLTLAALDGTSGLTTRVRNLLSPLLPASLPGSRATARFALPVLGPLAAFVPTDGLLR